MILPRRKLLLATPALVLPYRRALAQVGQVPMVVQPPSTPTGIHLISHTTIPGSPSGGTSVASSYR